MQTLSYLFSALIASNFTGKCRTRHDIGGILFRFQQQEPWSEKVDYLFFISSLIIQICGL